MATKYGINITMDQNTVVALQSAGYALYGFKGVKTSLQGGAPLVWIQSRQFSLNTSIAWQEEYQAYTSLSDIIANGEITASAAYDIDLGQTLKVENQSGTGRVVTGGTLNAISVNNLTNTQMSCGISQRQETTKSATPLCVFPLFGLGLDIMAPIQLVMLQFATVAVSTGTVIFQAFSQAILVDLTVEPELAVSFDINNGWSANGSPYAQFYPAGTDMRPLLLKP